MRWATVERSPGWCSTRLPSSALALIALALAALAATLLRPPPTSGPFGRDFEAYYAAGATWNAGGDPYSRDVWRVEREIAGVDATRDEVLPFVGPAASLPLWSALARMPFAVARSIWMALLAISVAVLAIGAAALARLRISAVVMFDVVLLAALAGPVVSDIALGQAALLAAAAMVLALIALERGTWWAVPAACIAALQPNLALPLAVRFAERRAALLLGLAALVFLAVTLTAGGGMHGLIAYVQRLGAHGAGERFIAIQYSVPAILAELHVPAGIALGAGTLCALIVAALTVAFTLRYRAQPHITATFAIALLPWFVPFFHEHDFAIELIPAIVLCAIADARPRVLAAIAAVCVLVDWFGVAQRPGSAPQTLALAFAVACAVAALPNRTQHAPQLWPTICAGALLCAGALPLALAFPAPVWPDALGAFHAAATLDASAVWAAEQQRSGLNALVPAWGILRAIPLLGCALLAFTALRAARAEAAQAFEG